MVQESEGRYTLISGERRWRAAQLAGLQSIPALIRQADETGSLIQALVENLQREDLTPLEEASAYRTLIDQHGMTQQELAHRVGKGRATVANSIRLLRLPPSILELLETAQLTAGHARALLSISDPKYATHIAKRAVAEGWTVRQVEEAAQAPNAPPAGFRGLLRATGRRRSSNWRLAFPTNSAFPCQSTIETKKAASRWHSTPSTTCNECSSKLTAP